MQNDAQIIEQALDLLRELAARPLEPVGDDELLADCGGVERLGRLIDGFTVWMINRTPWLLAPFELDPSQTWVRMGFNPATAVGALQRFRV